MKWFINLKISTKLITSFILVACLAAAVGAVGFIGMSNTQKAQDDIASVRLPSVKALLTMSEAQTAVLTGERGLVNRRMMDPEIRNVQYQYIEDAFSRAEEAWRIYEPLPQTQDEAVMWKQFVPQWEDWKEKSAIVVALSKEKDQLLQGSVSLEDTRITAMDQEIFDASLESQKFFIIAETTLNQLVDENMIEAERQDQAADASNEKMTMILIIIIALAVILAIALGLFISRIINKPLIQLKKASDKLAIGDIDIFFEGESKDEIGQLMKSFNEMTEGIKQQALVAEEISRGNFEVDVTVRSEHDILNKSMKNMNEKIKNMRQDIKNIIKNIENGRFNLESNAEDFDGGWKEIVSGIYHVIGSFVKYFDSLPIILMTVDKEYSINYLNKTGTDMFGTDHDGIFGKKCYNYFKTDDCKTEKCICERAMVDKKTSSGDNICYAGDNPMYIYYSGIPMIDGNGDITGVLEIVLDQTKVKLAQIVADKQAKYQEIEVKKLIDNLDLLAQGNLNIKTSLADSDEDTKGIANNFMKINDSLETSTNEIKSYVDELSNILSDMSEKDFTGGIEREYLGDFIKLKDSINNILEQFNSVLSEINASAEQVESGADQVASSSQGLSQGSSEQAGSVEEISASITQVTEQTKENAVNANKANDLSVKAKTDAQNGNAQMAEMLKAMNEIKESSKNISNIIKVIDEIAFQTNILALNAAVEAARAGEHGKGFAVVAEEVRNLAARSAKAAKETTELIDNSINKVDEGYKMANDTAEALGQIVTGVTNAVEIVSMIADASNEQANAIGEINQGIEQISQVTQSNTATAEESASASEEMAGQAQMLKSLIQEFKLQETVKKLQGNTAQVKKLNKPKSNRNADIEISLNDDSFGKY